MKNKLLFLFAIISSLSFGQNDKDRVQLMTVDNVDYFYKYDEQGRISKIRCSDWNYEEIYLYKKDSVLKYWVQMLDTGLQEIYVLDKTGLVDTWYTFGENNNFISFYKFDDNNRMQSHYSTSQLGNSLLSLEIRDGNFITERMNDSIKIEGKFRYRNKTVTNSYSERLNTLTHRNFGKYFFGTTCKNLLVKTITVTQHSDICSQEPCPILESTKETIEVKLDYLYDQNGRISQKVKTDVMTNTKSITKYYYY